MLKFIDENWQRFLFAVIGLITLTYSFAHLAKDDVAGASAIFAISFLCFLYSNLSRFKRFKGLGFEAELWEDKQKEAADLIERLKSVVAIYTRELVLGNVKRGRWSDSPGWKENWKLFDELVAQHNALGQKIDFSDLKREMDNYFIFDMCVNNDEGIQRAILDAQAKARTVIKNEFGSPIMDASGYAKRNAQLAEIRDRAADPFEVAKRGNLAEAILKMADEAKQKMSGYFQVEIEYDEKEISNLHTISEIYEKRPVEVTEALVSLTQKAT